jgi:hypothetical protein
VDRTVLLLDRRQKATRGNRRGKHARCKRRTLGAWMKKVRPSRHRQHRDQRPAELRLRLRLPRPRLVFLRRLPLHLRQAQRWNLPNLDAMLVHRLAGSSVAACVEEDHTVDNIRRELNLGGARGYAHTHANRQTRTIDVPTRKPRRNTQSVSEPCTCA